MKEKKFSAKKLHMWKVYNYITGQEYYFVDKPSKFKLKKLFDEIDEKDILFELELTKIEVINE